MYPDFLNMYAPLLAMHPPYLGWPVQTAYRAHRGVPRTADRAFRGVPRTAYRAFGGVPRTAYREGRGPGPRET